MKKIIENSLTIPSVALLALTTSCQEAQETKPNIVYILADDMGYGDLSCYGAPKISTPNIDKLAANGMLFTQHYAGSSVSSPSRSTLITGLHTGNTPVRGNMEVKDGEGQYPIPSDQYNIFKYLKEQGYATGTFGKWGLGYPGSHGDPNHQGVDDFYGYNCQRMAHNYYPYHLWDNQEMVMLHGNSEDRTEQYAPTLIHEQAMDFLKSNKDNPFFLYYASVIPHAEMVAPEEMMARYRGKLLPESHYQGAEYGDELFKEGKYTTQEECHAAFAAMMATLDEQVGEIVATLEEMGVLENTLIIFASDNGPSAEGGSDPDYFGGSGALRGVKRDLYEGGIRVPFIASWKNHIPAGTISDHISAFWDFFPTVVDLLNHPVEVEMDGISMLPTLLGEGEQVEHPYLYWEFYENGKRLAVRKGEWKGVIYNLDDAASKLELYNLTTDLGETNNVAVEHPEMVQELLQLMHQSHNRSEEYPLAPQALEYLRAGE